MSAFVLTLNIYVAVAGLLFTTGLLMRENRATIHVLAALLSGTIALGTLVRAIHYMTGRTVVTSWGFHFFFTLFPVIFILFFEKLTDHKLHVRTKLFVLLSTIGLLGTLIVIPNMVNTVWWAAWLAVLQFSTLGLSLRMLYLGIRHPATPERLRSIFTAMSIGLVVGIVLTSLDWLNRFGITMPVVGPMALLVVIHLLRRVFNSQGDFSVRCEAVHAGAGLIGLIAFGVVVVVFENNGIYLSAYELAMIMMLSFIPMTYLHHYLTKMHDFTPATILTRINALDHLDDLALFIGSLHRLDEIRHACWISPQFMTKIGCVDLPKNLDAYRGQHLSRTALSAKIEAEANIQKRRELEEVRHAMLAAQVDTIFFIDIERGFLGVQFTNLMDYSHYLELGHLLASFCKLISFNNAEPARLRGPTRVSDLREVTQ